MIASVSKGISTIPSVGGSGIPGLSGYRAPNMVDLFSTAGPEAYTSMYQVFGKDRGVKGFTEPAAMFGMMRTIMQQEYRADIASANRSSASTDISLSRRHGRAMSSIDFDEAFGAADSEIAALKKELDAIARVPGGRKSREYAQRRARYKQALSAKEDLWSTKIEGEYADIEANFGLEWAGQSLEEAKVEMYATSSSELARMSTTGDAKLAAYQSQLRAELKTARAHQDLPSIRRIESRLKGTEEQRVRRRGALATAAMRMDEYPLTLTEAQHQVEIARGLDSPDDMVAGHTFGIRRGDIAARRAWIASELGRENLPESEKRALRVQSASLDTEEYKLGVAARTFPLERASMRYETEMAETGVTFARTLAYGSAADIRGAVGGRVGMMMRQWSRIRGEVDAGGLTMEQEQGMRRQMASLSSDAFSLLSSGADAEYRASDLTGYSMSAMRLSEMEKRLQYAPYAPGNMMGIAAAGIRLRTGRIAELRAREHSLAERNLLSNERRFEIESQIEGLTSQNWQALSEFSQGIENRLPAMSAGMPGGFGRFNTMTLAAAHMARIGFPYRGFGAVGGRQANAQDAAFSGLGIPTASAGTTSLLNAMMQSGGAINLLARIASSVEKMAAGATDPKASLPARGSRGLLPGASGVVGMNANEGVN
jgi:hypothetical protein